MLGRIKKVCLSSLTIAWGYCLALAGTALQIIDYVADPLGDPELRSQIASAVGNPQVAGWILQGISLITIVARLRSLRKAV
jgi:hypothetical protein